MKTKTHIDVNRNTDKHLHDACKYTSTYTDEYTYTYTNPHTYAYTYYTDYTYAYVHANLCTTIPYILSSTDIAAMFGIWEQMRLVVQ